MQSLRDQAKKLGPEPSTRESAPNPPDIAALAERFVEPLRGETPPAPSRPAPPKPPMVQRQAGLPRVEMPPKQPVAGGKPRRSRNALVAAVVVLALIPLAILIIQLWQDMMQPQPGSSTPSAVALKIDGAPQAAEPAPEPKTPDVVLTAPDRIETSTGAFINFPIAIDATQPLPPRSIVAVTGLPEGASFSEGRPFGKDGWSLSTEEIAGLRLRLPARTSVANLQLELVAGDGNVLSQSKTALSVTPPPVATVDTPIAVENLPEVETAAATEIPPAEQTASIAALAPPPQRKPSAPAEPEVKVNKVKVVTIQPPREKKPYDGAYALGAPVDDPVEWMETTTAVDMHAKAEQKSETVKVAQGGLKVQVKARDNRWVQVLDPKSGTTGWIYDRFLKETEAPAN